MPSSPKFSGMHEFMSEEHAELYFDAPEFVELRPRGTPPTEADIANIEPYAASMIVYQGNHNVEVRKLKTITVALAPEMLSQIFEYLDLDSIRNIRGICSAFEKAAWPAFATSFNDNVFHPTWRSLKTLRELSQCKSAVPYMKTLKISTINLNPFEPDFGFLPSPPDVLKAFDSPFALERFYRVEMAKILREAMANLTSLKTICVVDADTIRPVPKSLTRAPQRKHLFYDTRAYRHVLEVVHGALANPRCANNYVDSFLPNITSLTSSCCVPISALSGCRSRVTLSPVSLSKICLDHTLRQITRLELNVNDTTPPPSTNDGSTFDELKIYLPEFLAAMPNISDLTLHFPRENVLNDQPLFSLHRYQITKLFEAVAELVHLPHLAKLELSHLRLLERAPLCNFLANHDKLTDIKLTSLALGYAEWRPFMKFTGTKTNVECFVMKSDLTIEEKRIVEAGWARVPRSLRLRSEDYQGAAKKWLRYIEVGTDRLYSRGGQDE